MRALRSTAITGNDFFLHTERIICDDTHAVEWLLFHVVIDKICMDDRA